MVFKANHEEVSITVTEQKWAKERNYILELILLTNWDPGDYSYLEEQQFTEVLLEYKLLEKMQGYFCHLAMTFHIIFPYFKVFHLTLSSHLEKRNKKGWKLEDLEMIGHLENLQEKGLLPD